MEATKVTFGAVLALLTAGKAAAGEAEPKSPKVSVVNEVPGLLPDCVAGAVSSAKRSCEMAGCAEL